MAMVKIIFTEAFANKAKGEVGEYDSSLASHLIHVDKCAKLYKEKSLDSKPKKPKK